MQSPTLRPPSLPDIFIVKNDQTTKAVLAHLLLFLHRSFLQKHSETSVTLLVSLYMTDLLVLFKRTTK